MKKNAPENAGAQRTNDEPPANDDTPIEITMMIPKKMK